MGVADSKSLYLQRLGTLLLGHLCFQVYLKVMLCAATAGGQMIGKNGKRSSAFFFLGGEVNQPVHSGSRSSRYEKAPGAEAEMFWQTGKWAKLSFSIWDSNGRSWRWKAVIAPCIPVIMCLDRMLTYITQYGEIAQTVWICHFEQGLPFCLAFKKENFLQKHLENDAPDIKTLPASSSWIPSPVRSQNQDALQAPAGDELCSSVFSENPFNSFQLSRALHNDLTGLNQPLALGPTQVLWSNLTTWSTDRHFPLSGLSQSPQYFYTTHCDLSYFLVLRL